MSKTKSDIEKVLTQGPRTDLSKDFSRASGVALLLCEEAGHLEVLFIKRALNPSDNWSGHLAFPGGKKDETDASLLDACVREVREEVGVILDQSCLIGSLDDLQARKRGNLLEFYIQPFVFYLPQKPKLIPDPKEVERTLWVSLDYLLNVANRTEYKFQRDNMKLALPAIQFPDGDVLWGLTYMMIQNLFWKIQNYRQ
ncbi:NUDIX hydrolase [Bdellovibrio sp. HCB337]|uniref:NUDIX hydrolase n=1 Tax=Bdellovibrio sp. HCB337 TaxID=3394358 RepID=UPI0039A654D5